MQNLLRALNSGEGYPSYVSLDEYVSTWFSCLWRLSLIRPVREHGAALVEADGRLTVAVARSGSEAEFPLKDEEMREVSFVGYFHTHPYESGTTGVAFSAGDLRVTINLKMKMCVVQSGDELFMVVRTPKTPEHLPIDEPVETDFEKRVASYRRRPGRSWQGAVLEANLHFCRKYRLAFYASKLEHRLQLLHGGG